MMQILIDMLHLQKVEFIFCDFVTLSFLNNLMKLIIAKNSSSHQLDSATESTDTDRIRRDCENNSASEGEIKIDLDEIKNEKETNKARIALKYIDIRSSNLCGCTKTPTKIGESIDTGANGENHASFGDIKARFYDDFGIKLNLF